MSRGNISRRGKASWRLKYEQGARDATGKRRIAYVTVNGTRRDAERELVRRLASVDAGTHVDPARTTVGEYLRAWLDAPTGLSAKTVERYRQLAAQQLAPHIGHVKLQQLRPAAIEELHAKLLKAGGKNGAPLSARTVGHCHRLLRAALERAARAEIIGRNVAAIVPPPKVQPREVQILTREQIAAVLSAFEGHVLGPLVALAVGSGARRGELCGLAWGCVDLDRATIRIERSLEETSAGLRIKAPKSRHGVRTISIPRGAREALRAHRLQQQQYRLTIGAGRIEGGDYVFTTPTLCPLSPDNLSRDWRRALVALKLPQARFHDLRHFHASTLIAAGVDVLSISRRLGHATPGFTLTVYGHLFPNTDQAAARAIDAALAGA